jgi:hypothetical protein
VRDASCPICNADVPTAGDERAGDTVYCTYCGAPLKITRKATAEEEADELEEDF